jgi:hypothetical protein
MDIRQGDRTVGRSQFTDSNVLDVYEDADGRQYVLDTDGKRVYEQQLPKAVRVLLLQTRTCPNLGPHVYWSWSYGSASGIPLRDARRPWAKGG